MTGERGTHTKPTGMIAIEVTTYEEERVWSIFSDREVQNGGITVWWTVQYTYKHEVGVEGKP